ncbi:MAG: ABC transporter permease [Defluviitaleaceae bacterium]|nr:ABC transporter permease [Defluviitaleaceae bacterium]
MNPFWKDINREISATKSRFISLMLISLLGAFVVVGIHATAIHMRDAADAAYRRANLYDLQLRHPIGFSPEDVEVIRNLEIVYSAMPTNITDIYIYVGDTQRTMRTYSLPTLPEAINIPTLLEGRLPATPYEIAVERRFLREGGFSIGDMADDYLVVGLVESPLYLTGARGNTTLGDGTIRFFAYVYPVPIYTDIYVIMEGSRDLHQVSDVYNAAAQEWRQQLEAVLAEAIGGFVFTRQNGIAFESYFQDTQRLQQVGYVFPIVFFLVAVLVSLTTMTRMVEEQRGQIGIYKALGYKSGTIFMKYLLYAVISGLSGGILGTILGTNIVPRIIFDAYGHLYNMPHSNHPIPWGVAAISIFSAVLSVTAAVFFVCLKAVQEESASLMRPKAPTPGKRVLIEKIPPLWNRLSFISKVTSRNIFRYKGRFFMTLAGVAGCTALLVTAFGLGDSIGSVARLQFEEIIRYDAHIITRELSYADQAELLVLTMESRNDGPTPKALFIRSMTADAHTQAGGFPASIIVPEDMSHLTDFVYLESQSNEGVLVTEKLAREMDIRTGDEFTITLGDGQSHNVQTVGIAENYLLHFIYMPQELFLSIFEQESFRPNGLFIIGDIDLPIIRQHSSVMGISNTAWMRDNLREQTDALGIVTIVLMIAACILALIVLFNLTEINILERMRELATIKVLGFQDIETAMYLYRENMVVTLMGIALGLIGGVFLNSFILTTVEIDMLKFPHIINPTSFLLASGISVLFALMVNALTYRKLMGIDMVGALKSVE